MIDFKEQFGEDLEQVRSNYMKETESGDVLYRLDIFRPLQEYVEQMQEEHPGLKILGVKEGCIDLVVNKEGEKLIRNNITIILQDGEEEPYYINTSLKLQFNYAEAILDDLSENFLAPEENSDGEKEEE